MKRLGAAALTAISISLPSVARADELPVAKAPITKPIELRHNLKLELPILGALAVVTVGFRVLRDDMEPSYCRICEGKELNAVDKWFRDAMVRKDTDPAQVTSYVLAFGAAPLAGAALTILAAVADEAPGGSGGAPRWSVDLTAVAEGGFAAMLTTEILESLTLRERPFFHAITDPDQRQKEIDKTGAFHSFPAGHVVEAFGVATAAGVVASMRGYRLAPLVWLVGMGIGVATAYTRIASDHHYFTDTLAGAAIGSVVGGAIPLLFHRPRPIQVPTLMAMPIPGGVNVSAGWTL